MNSTTQTKAEKTKVTKLMSKNGRKRDEDSSRSVKSQSSKLAVKIVEEVVPEVTTIPTSNEDLSDAPDDMDEETEIEQQPRHNMKMKAVISIEDWRKKLAYVVNDSMPLGGK